MSDSTHDSASLKGTPQRPVPQDCVYRWFNVNVYRKSTDDMTAMR